MIIAPNWSELFVFLPRPASQAYCCLVKNIIQVKWNDNMAISAALIASISLFFTSCVEADTPANCSYADIQGKWMFYVGKSGQTNQIDCGEVVQPVEEITVNLLFPDNVVDSFGNLGKWTMIYNQGFEVRIAEKRYFAYSRYHKEGNSTISMCDSTLNGWAHNEVSEISPVFPPSNWSCFYGKNLLNVCPTEPSIKYVG